MQFHGQNFQSAEPEIAQIPAAGDLCVSAGKFPGVSQESLSRQRTQRALSADSDTGFVWDLWVNDRQVQTGRAVLIENGRQEKRGKHGNIGSDGHL